MEWVEVTGKTVEEAKEAALDQLGVTEDDAELVVLAEPKTGLFGRVRGEARVRARVRPVGPRPKRQRRTRDRARTSGGRGGRGGGEARSARATASTGQGGRSTTERTGGQERPAAGEGSGGSSAARRRRRRGGRRRGGARAGATASDGARAGGSGGDGAVDGASAAPPASGGPLPADGGKGNGKGNGTSGGRSQSRRPAAAKEESTVAEGMTLQEQAEVAREFLEGLMEQYGLTATLEVRELDEETVELAAMGDGLGVLVGPKGATLAALQDVTRAVVQRRFPTRTDRILVDVAGYRERRAAALGRFSQQVAAEVSSSGEERALEPMSPADRKVVHDTVAAIDGVASRSEGEDPNRYVVIAPAS